MPRAAISKYFDATEHRQIRDDLLFAVGRVVAPKIAVDCGCGAGADISYLVSAGFAYIPGSRKEACRGSQPCVWGAGRGKVPPIVKGVMARALRQIQ